MYLIYCSMLYNKYYRTISMFHVGQIKTFQFYQQHYDSHLSDKPLTNTLCMQLVLLKKRNLFSLTGMSLWMKTTLEANSASIYSNKRQDKKQGPTASLLLFKNLYQIGSITLWSSWKGKKILIEWCSIFGHIFKFYWSNVNVPRSISKLHIYERYKYRVSQLSISDYKRL